MTRWMVANGAGNLVLLSRTGSVTGKVKELIDDMNAEGANVVVRSCNIAEKASVDNLFGTGLEGLPPVRGVVHGAMVLRVSVDSLQGLSSCVIAYKFEIITDTALGRAFRKDDMGGLHHRHRV